MKLFILCNGKNGGPFESDVCPRVGDDVHFPILTGLEYGDQMQSVRAMVEKCVHRIDHNGHTCRLFAKEYDGTW